MIKEALKEKIRSIRTSSLLLTLRPEQKIALRLTLSFAVICGSAYLYTTSGSPLDAGKQPGYISLEGENVSVDQVDVYLRYERSFTPLRIVDNSPKQHISVNSVEFNRSNEKISIQSSGEILRYNLLEPGCSANITTKKATVHKPDADLVGSTKGKTLVVSRSTPGTCDISVVYKINRIDFPRGQFNVLSSRIDINETNLVVLTSGNHYSCQIAQCIVPHWNGSYRTHFVYVDEYTVNSPKNNNGQMEKNGTEYKFDREPKWWNRSFSDDTSNGKRLHGSAFTEINGHTFEISLFYE